MFDVDFFERAIEQESGFNVHAVSKAGALGIAQFMPSTAAGRGIDPLDPEQALRGSAALFREYLDQYKSPELALAAYNAGPGAVATYGGVPPFDETRNYIRSILGTGPRTDQPSDGGRRNPFDPMDRAPVTGPNPFDPFRTPAAIAREGNVVSGPLLDFDPLRGVAQAIEAVRQGAAQLAIAAAVIVAAGVLAYGGARKMLG